MNNEVYTITEYQGFVRGDAPTNASYQRLDPQTFDALEEFILSNKNRNADAVELLSLSARKGVGKVISAKNYVGIIKINNGTIIEILPKINRGDVDVKEAKKLFLKMLASQPDFQFKQLQTVGMDISKLDIFEVFIRMFIEAVQGIVKKGIKADYITKEENLAYFKGKFLISEHIKANHTHREKFYVSYDEFSPNRAENKLIKAALAYLYKYTSNLQNKKDIRILLESFANVDIATNYVAEFAKCKDDRTMASYKVVLDWVRIFLQGQSFTAYAGSNVALALLFPMNALFESYIAYKAKLLFRGRPYIVSAQDKGHYLYDTPKAFALRPDIVISSKNDDIIHIFDTKWKTLSKNQVHYGISQGDMYQMYAYQHRYNSKDVTLLYPAMDDLNDFEYTTREGDIVRVKFIDLLHDDESIKECFSDIN